MYVITDETVAIIPKHGPLDGPHAIVYEINRTLEVAHSPSTIVQRHVRKFAQSFQRQLDKSKELFPTGKKLPIYVPTPTTLEAVFIPTHAYTNPNAAWFSLLYVAQFKNGRLLTLFDEAIPLKITESSFYSQLAKGYLLQQLAMKRQLVS